MRSNEIRETLEVSLSCFKDDRETVEVSLSRKVDFLRRVFEIWVSDRKTRGSLFGKVVFWKRLAGVFSATSEIQK